MQNDTRDIRMSVDQIKYLIEELEKGGRPNEELIDMLEMTLEEDPETLNDFTA